MNIDIEQLVGELTLQEKVLLLAGADMWHSNPVERLKIPVLKVSDGPNGIRGVGKDTKAAKSASFPIGTAMGATWNPRLIREVGKALAQEAKDKGAHVLLAPTVNIHRAPLAGRNFECFSEDPFLTSKMAVAYITGLQGEGIAACVKHFVCNDQEFERFSISSQVDERTMREIYLPPFEAAVKVAGSWTLMSAYNRVNGTHASENDELLLDLLKDEWGFDGLVISDWYGTYSDNVVDSGLDLEMPGPGRWMGENVIEMVQSGAVEESRIDDKVRRLLLLLARTGAFEQDLQEEELTIDRPETRSLIRRVGAEAVVLLKNEGSLLPLEDDRPQKIAVIGENAMRVSFQGGGSSEVNPHYVVSPLDGISAQAKEGVEVLYALGTPVNKQPPILDPSWLISEDGTPGEIKTFFYGNTSQEGDPVFITPSAGTELSWFGETAPHFDPNHFSMVAIGSFTAPTTGRYVFTFSCIGRGKWFHNGEAVIDLSDRPEIKAAPAAAVEGTVELELVAGEKYDLRLEYAAVAGPRWRTIRLGCEPPKPVDPIEEAVEAARGADIAVVFAGLTPEWEGEGDDRVNMDLPGRQNELISRVAEVNPNTVVVLNAGSPLHMPWIEKVPAVIQMWYLGQESGNAIADVLFGKADPGGRLPTTIPRKIQDSPAFVNFPGENGEVRYGEGLFVGYRYFDKKEIAPLFPFGHGLSYTTFEYTNLRLNKHVFSAGDEVRVEVDVTNRGAREGSEVVQLYVRDIVSRLTRPEKELKGFSKITMQPGETRRVEITLSSKDLAFYDVSKNGWVVESGDFEIMVGHSAENIYLKDQFTWEAS